MEKTDPTILTTEQSEKAVACLREVVEARMDGMDKAYDRRGVVIDNIPQLIRQEVERLTKLHDERFHSVEKEMETRFEGVATQFLERDKRTEQLSLADKTAIAAALQAQKEAAGATNESNSVALGKMEAAFTKLIDQQGIALGSLDKTISDKINDVKGRLDRGEGKTSVSDPAVSEGIKQLGMMIADLSKSRDVSDGQGRGRGDVWGFIIGGAGLITGIISVVILIVKTAN